MISFILSPHIHNKYQIYFEKVDKRCLGSSNSNIH